MTHPSAVSTLLYIRKYADRFGFNENYYSPAITPQAIFNPESPEG